MSMTILVNVLARSDNGALLSSLGLIRPESSLILFHCALGPQMNNDIGWQLTD